MYRDVLYSSCKGMHELVGLHGMPCNMLTKQIKIIYCTVLYVHCTVYRISTKNKMHTEYFNIWYLLVLLYLLFSYFPYTRL